MNLYTYYSKYLIVFNTLLIVFCYFLLLLFMEILNLKKYKVLLTNLNRKKLKPKHENIYNNYPYYLSKNWYMEKTL